MKISHWKLIGIVVLLATVMAALIACTRGNEAAPKPVQVKPGEKISICQGGAMAVLPLIAREQGYFSEAGLDVQIVNKKDGKLAMDALLAEECAFATCGEPPLVTKSFTREDYAVLATLSTNENATKIVARKDLGITVPKDLKGKVIGVRKGTLSHFFLDQFLKKNVIRSQDVTLRFMEPGDLVDALARGEIVAFSATDELVLTARKKLGATALVMSEPGLCFNAISLVARKELINARPETVKALLKALIRAEEYAVKHPGEVSAMVGKEKGISSADLAVILKDQVASVTLQKTLLLTLEDHARWMIETAGTEKHQIPNLLKIIDPAPLLAVKPSAVEISR